MLIKRDFQWHTPHGTAVVAVSRGHRSFAGGGGGGGMVRLANSGYLDGFHSRWNPKANLGKGVMGANS